ncbi:MAG: hypothetical protein COT06_04630 [Syntrophobacteraceae bacterium CG07_land_8_20_14_0_80_61_8]|nr:MAG: hypothetical protein COT06_04630 [Syntrophobacteraceae bacterium CG07_land_8_20_14_0_80_61_8]
MVGNPYLSAATKLYAHLLRQHWNGQCLVGPDPVGKVHWRVTRFVRSYLPWLPFDDKYVYLQGQAYWIKANLLMYERYRESRFLYRALHCADYMAAVQPPDGAWRHPPIWGRRGFIATVEGVWASLGLLAAYRYGHRTWHLDAARKWFDFQLNCMGFIDTGWGLAARYYLHDKEEVVPNVSAVLLWLMAELADVTGKSIYLRYAWDVCCFLRKVQMPSGELPYVFPSRKHFQCYQYNAFQFMDLLAYMKITDDRRVLPILQGLAGYLMSGLSPQGACRYDCFHQNPETNYWTAALAAALRFAELHNFMAGQRSSCRAYQHLIRRQQGDGRFSFSDKNYEVLSDHRSYPRQQAMLLYFLLLRGCQGDETAGTPVGYDPSLPRIVALHQM